jgi:hypothetical protein
MRKAVKQNSIVIPSAAALHADLVILSGAAFQAERRIFRSPSPERKPNRPRNPPFTFPINSATMNREVRCPMPQYVIEREIPGAGKLSDAELQAVARKSVSVLKDMGPEIKWLHSYVTGDKVYCVYLAPDEETVREHARRGGFPANRISAVRSLMDPDTAN